MVFNLYPIASSPHPSCATWFLGPVSTDIDYANYLTPPNSNCTYQTHHLPNSNLNWSPTLNKIGLIGSFWIE